MDARFSLYFCVFLDEESLGLSHSYSSLKWDFKTIHSLSMPSLLYYSKNTMKSFEGSD